jgi:DNA-binding NtrC family response regulator
MPSILLIDDDDGLRRMLAQMLTRAGYEVTEAVNGRDGLWKLRQKKADLVVTDLIMPDQEGLETIMALKQEFPGIKVIAMSGGARMSGHDFLPAALGLGAAATLKKPFARDEFLQTVAKFAGPGKPVEPA